MPCTTNCTGHNPNPYTCHAAALHWAFMDHGCTQIEANNYVTKLTKASCPGCKAKGPQIGISAAHSSISASEYGKMFCFRAQRIRRPDLHTTLHPGDILITGHPSMPNHSMIVRQVRGANHVTVRGFNNYGTLGTGALLQYDPVSHNITKDKYWASDDMFGANRPGIQLYFIPYADYAGQVARCMNMRF